MRFFSIIIFLILFNFSFGNRDAFSQDTLKYNINWQPPIPSWFSSDSVSPKFLFNFQDAKHNSEGIPTFSQNFPIDANCSEVKLKINSLIFDTIPVSTEYSHLSDIPESLNFSSEILKEEKKKFVQISVIPVIRKKENIFLLKSFSLELSKVINTSLKKSYTDIWKSTSVLSSGIWRKFAVGKTGVYKITFNELKELGFSDPSAIRLYGNGGKMLPEKFSGNEVDDLKEIPLYFSLGADGVFNEGDYIVFYATGPVTWDYDTSSRKFVHSKHLFTEKIFYFLTSGGNGAKIQDEEQVFASEEITINSFVDYDVHEENQFNLIKSGREWFGDRFALQPSKIFTFTFPDPVENSNFSIDGEVLARSDINTNYAIGYNNQTLKTVIMNSVNPGDETSNHADSKTFSTNSILSGKDLNIGITFEKNGDNSAEGWLNYVRVNVKRKLKFNGTQLLFRDTSALKQNKIALFSIENSTSNLLVWDVTELNKVKNISFGITGSVLTFKTFTDTLHEFVVFDPSKALSPDFITSEKNVDNQNLHSLSNEQMVIISPKEFFSEAEELAEIHRSRDNFNVVTVTPDQIYNEFSSGNPDPAAYRNFMKMLYDKAAKSEEMPKYLLLFGDGSYKNLSDNSDGSEEVNSNLLLTYQSANSVRPVSSYVSDDYFGLLDDNESIESGLLDIGIGRFPITSVSQANAIINKIKKYISSRRPN